MRLASFVLSIGHATRGAVQTEGECLASYNEGYRAIDELERLSLDKIKQMIPSVGEAVAPEAALDVIRDLSEVVRGQITHLTEDLNALGCKQEQQYVTWNLQRWLDGFKDIENALNKFKQFSEKLCIDVQQLEEKLDNTGVKKTSMETEKYMVESLEQSKRVFTGSLSETTKEVFRYQIERIDQQIEAVKLRLQAAQEEVTKRHRMAGTNALWFTPEGYLDYSAHGMYIWDGLKRHNYDELSVEEYAFFDVEDKSSPMGFVVLSFNVYRQELVAWKVKRPLDREVWVPSDDWSRGFCSTALPIVIRDFVAKMNPQIRYISLSNDAKDNNIAACHCYIGTFRALGFTKVVTPQAESLDGLLERCLARDVSQEFYMRVSPQKPELDIDSTRDADAKKILAKASIQFHLVPH
jgi:hypothetical protein